MTAETEAEYVSFGYSVWSCELMHRVGHKFVRTNASHTRADGTRWHMLDYTTCRLNRSVTLAVFPYSSGDVSEATQQKTDALVESIRIY